MPTRRRLLASLSTAALAAPPAAFAYTYREYKVDATTQTTYTLTAFNIGAASADRIVVAIIWTQTSAAQPINSVTIGGVTATNIVNLNAGESRGLSAWFAAVPTGTTADVVVTAAGNLNRCAVGVSTITGTTQTTYSSRSGSIPDSGSTVNSITTPAAGSITIPTGGVAIAAAWLGSSTPTITWTQTTGSGTQNLVGTNFAASMSGSLYSSTNASAQQYTADGADSVQYRALAFTWGP